ncbi:MAG: uracil-DNA glycosylase [Gammaproteobacteria bacterium]|nr:uracil-DNA glycosylase [Gammaproteobacteria bacterium]MBD3776179.1 uracil-DNA glycosylase [Thiotrichales bacterium]
MKKTNSIDCFKCRFFYVTWDANNPRGCKAFGFKTKRLPSDVVFEASGEPCMKFSPRPDNPPSGNTPRGGWVA